MVEREWTESRNVYKTRNTGTGNRVWETRGIGNILKHSGECSQASREMSSNIPGNITKYFGEYPQTLRGMFSNIPRNVAKHPGKCPQKIYRIFENNLGHVVKHSVESMKGFG